MQIFINGAIAGAVIALMAVAFQAVYLPTRVFFVALAGVYAAVPFVVASIFSLTGNVWLAVAAGLSAGVGLSLLIESFIHLPLARKDATSGAQLVSSLGAYIMIAHAVAMIWGSNPQTLRRGNDFVTRWQGIVVTGAQWISLVTSVVLIAAFLIFLRRANVGIRLRALADDPIQFSLYGFNVERYRLLSFGLAGLMASSASLVSAFETGFDAYVGLHATLLAVVAVIVGGRHSFVGPVVGGLLLGIIRSQVVWHLSARWQEAVSFGLLAIVLIAFPNGLCGHRQRLEAE